MCGIAGIFMAGRPGESPGQSGHDTVRRETLERMTRAITHRGPDDEGYHVRGPVGLGFRRLSIIDLAGGHQPMLTEDQKLAIIFNGEIYNYRALKKELEERGHKFRTASDTEVILLAYREWGTDSVRRLRGMFAIAIWDENERSLFLARDRFGIKPLYYSWDGRTLRFGSEIKSILEDPEMRVTLDPLALDEYLTYLYVPAPRSIFREIRKLLPGHWLRVTQRGLEDREYWDLVMRPDPTRSEEETVLSVRAALEDSVASHLMSEVPLGAFLSGGIDSSAVVGIMAGLIDRPVQTASIGFREDAYDELPFARRVAAAFRTDAHERTVEANAADILDRLTWHYDEPFADSSMVPTWYVSQAARERVTVALSGDGGDENFAGYRRMRIDALENRIRSSIPRWVRRGVLAPVAAAYPKADTLPRLFRGKTLITNLSLTPERAYHNTMRWFTPAMKARLYRPALRAQVGDHDPFSVQEEYFRRSEGWDSLSRIQYVDFKTYLPDDILAKVDRASMAHSLEVRVPLLDHVFVEHVATIPASMKLRRGEGKYIFKRALQGLVPDEVLTRKKMGFGVPIDRWFRGELRVPFETRVLARGSWSESLFEPSAIRHLWNQHQRGARDHSYGLWALLVLEHWGRRFGGAIR